MKLIAHGKGGDFVIGHYIIFSIIFFGNVL
jgi:hypothetical protein